MTSEREGIDMEAELYRLLDAARQVIRSNGYARDIDDRGSWLVSTDSMKELVRAVEDAEPSPRDKLMQAYEKAGMANALYVKKHYGSPNG